jgi:hypothetical protein
MPRNTQDAAVINLNSVREEKIEEKRREYERVVFRSNFGVYACLPENALQAVEVVDISEGGMLFQVPESSSFRLDVGQTTHVKFYFSPDSFIAIDVKVARSFTALENGKAVHRYGCLMDKTMKSYAAIFHLVQFITKCAEHGHKDDGRHKIFY